MSVSREFYHLCKIQQEAATIRQQVLSRELKNPGNMIFINRGPAHSTDSVMLFLQHAEQFVTHRKDRSCRH